MYRPPTGSQCPLCGAYIWEPPVVWVDEGSLRLTINRAIVRRAVAHEAEIRRHLLGHWAFRAALLAMGVARTPRGGVHSHQ